MTADTQAPQAEVGQARPRKEDARLVTGQTNWTDNIVLPGMLHMAFVRSPMAHARITSVDLSAARAMPCSPTRRSSSIANQRTLAPG